MIATSWLTLVWAGADLDILQLTGEGPWASVLTENKRDTRLLSERLLGGPFRSGPPESLGFADPNPLDRDSNFTNEALQRSLEAS
jgi:hypothetical protein